MVNESLYSRNLRTPSKTFFFDIRESKKSGHYVTLTESKIVDGERVKSYMTLRPEFVSEFIKVLQDINKTLKNN